jgi:leucyl-tRNA synthetase
MDMFGENFEKYSPDAEPEVPTASSQAGPGESKPVDKAKKGKVAAKATGHTYQFQIMESIGIPREEIKKFADPYFWTSYFPPIAKVTDVSPVYCITYADVQPNRKTIPPSVLG